MPRPTVHWYQYPPSYAALAKRIAVNSDKTQTFGEYTEKHEAMVARQTFYRFRYALRSSPEAQADPNSYPARLASILETLSLKVRQIDDRTWTVLCDIDPFIKAAFQMDSELRDAHRRQLAHFIELQRGSPAVEHVSPLDVPPPEWERPSATDAPYLDDTEERAARQAALAAEYQAQQKT